MSINPGTGEHLEQQADYPNLKDLFLGGVALGSAEVGQVVDDPTVRKILMGVAIVSGAWVMTRLFRADTSEEVPPVEQFDVFGQE
jgi:hypothetical protein